MEILLKYSNIYNRNTNPINNVMKKVPKAMMPIPEENVEEN